MNQNKQQFSITETVNKNVENHQFPSFRNHKSLVGWCTMNYPRVLKNPLFMPKPLPKEDPTHLDYLYQLKMRQDAEQKFILKKPFQNLQKIQKPILEEKVGVPPDGYKNSTLSLTTSKREARSKIIEETNKDLPQYSSFLPLSCEIPVSKVDENFSRHVKQIGEITYEPNYESEEIRHLKKLPNSILTEQNLMEVLNSELKYLNLQNHTWIKNEFVNKIGYFAPNIEELNLSGTDLVDEVLYELAISCSKLHSIDISNCPVLTEQGIKKFLNAKPNIKKFFAAHNDHSVTDNSLQPLKDAPQLQRINLSFDYNITNATLDYFIDKGQKFKHISFSNCQKLSGEKISVIISNSMDHLKYLDLSFMTNEEASKHVMEKIGDCRQLEQLILTGTANIEDSGISQMINGTSNVKKAPTFQFLKTIKLGGLKSLTNGQLSKLFQITPNLEFAELNNLENISEEVLVTLIKYCQNIQRIFINFTPSIGDVELEEIKQQNPDVLIVRNINKFTDVKDDGLRMPFPPVNLKKKKKKKKKK
ncbi:hypothetical protein ABPG74_015594 [Tetrahymena malaccensis]